MLEGYNGRQPQSRRSFVRAVGKLGAAAALGGNAASADESLAVETADLEPSGWDLSWIDELTKASDRAVFDWTTFGEAPAPLILQLAQRYLDNCETVYTDKAYLVRIVVNVRAIAAPIALNDGVWKRYSIGGIFGVKDPHTGNVAERNPFWHDESPATATTLERLAQRGAIILVCDFALRHLAAQAARKVASEPDVVYRDLRASFVPGAIAVPSGIFGLARSQNSGCALVGI